MARGFCCSGKDAVGIAAEAVEGMSGLVQSNAMQRVCLVCSSVPICSTSWPDGSGSTHKAGQDGKGLFQVFRAS